MKIGPYQPPCRDAMANTYPSIAAQLPQHAIPAQFDLASVDQAWDLLTDSSDGDRLTGESRHGWLAAAVERTAAKYELHHLSFLYCKPWLSPEGCSVFLFKPGEIVGVIGDISIALDQAESQPENFSDLLADGSSTSDVRAALHSAVASLCPSGDCSDYFFAYMKSLKWFFESARDAGRAVLYMQWNS